MKISDWLVLSTKKLKNAGITSARLDSELILTHAIQKSRTFLHAHPEFEISDKSLSIANENLRKRTERIPLAYIFERKEFFGREFIVSPDVLVPRPESEIIIELLKELQATGDLLDVGTGSGCLGITAKLELPKINVVLSDISNKALRIARNNAKNLNANVTLLESNLLENISGKFDVIIANLPYVDRAWHRSPETNYEPSLALFTKNRGLELIFEFLDQAPNHLKPGAKILLEADPEQHSQIVHYAKVRGFKLDQIRDYVIVLEI